jgi:hypothetical protein
VSIGDTGQYGSDDCPQPSRIGLKDYNITVLYHRYYENGRRKKWSCVCLARGYLGYLLWIMGPPYAINAYLLFLDLRPP